MALRHISISSGSLVTIGYHCMLKKVKQTVLWLNDWFKLVDPIWSASTLVSDEFSVGALFIFPVESLRLLDSTGHPQYIFFGKINE